eukprot:UN04159
MKFLFDIFHIGFYFGKNLVDDCIFHPPFLFLKFILTIISYWSIVLLQMVLQSFIFFRCNHFVYLSYHHCFYTTTCFAV